MRIQVYLIIFITLVANSNFAQLANWKPTSGTNFPTNLVWQINGMTRICQMKFHPTDNNKFYALTAEGGLHFSVDKGENWTAAPGTENMTGSCASLCVDYTNDQVIFLGTGDPNYYSNGQGIKKSIDGGQTFSATGLLNCLVVEIIQNTTNANEFVAATNRGIYKSVDGGQTWLATLSIALPFCDLKVGAAANSQILFAVTRETKAKLFRSTDYGNTWTQITNGIQFATNNVTEGGRIAVTPADPNVVYFEMIGGGGLIHKSMDGGLNFTLQKAQGSPYLTFYDDDVSSSAQGDYDNCIAVDRSDPTKLWLQAHNTWYSEDSGLTWTQLTHWASIVHTDMHQIQQAPFDENLLYTCSDGGVWLSEDRGLTWTPKCNGIFGFEIATNAGTSSPIKKDFVSIGTQDNARLYGDENGWFTISGGDDYARRQIDYLGNIYFEGTDRQLNHTGSTVYSGIPTTDWYAFGFNRTDVNLGFMAYNDVYRSTDLNADPPNWTKISNFNKNIKAIHSCIADRNRLYVITSNQKIYISKNALDAVPDFVLYQLPFPSGAGTSVAAMANNADIVYITLGSKVFRSADGGITWEDQSFNLPSILHKKLLAEEYGGTEELVFLATNNAVFYKKIGQTSWTNYSTNLPSRRAPTDFSMFDDGTKQARIRYATYGRGMWESSFENLRTYQASILVNGDSVLTCNKPGIEFADGSLGLVGSPISYQWSFPGGFPASSTTAQQYVIYDKSGTYTITLTVTNAQSEVSTQVITKYIQVLSCWPDTIPGGLLEINEPGNYAKTSPISLGTTNTITLSAWIKIDQYQNDYAGIIFSNNGGATGLNFTSGNRLGYHFNENPSTYFFEGGPIVPQNTWTHVSLVTTANDATLYMNGVPYINPVANAPVDFVNAFHIGNDRDIPDRTMNGQIDEICFYDRALSQNEIREQMHLTKNHLVKDVNLISYFQANEIGPTVFDRVGSATASLTSLGMRKLSTAPVGSGSSKRMLISVASTEDFEKQALTLSFPSAIVPDGEICVTKLNLLPDSLPKLKESSMAIPYYWIIHNYGNNSSFDPISEIQFKQVGKMLAEELATPNRFKLYERSAGGFLVNEWILLDSASMVSAQDLGHVYFNHTSISSFDKQFLLMKDLCDDLNLNGELVIDIFPNPNDGNFMLKSNYSGILQVVNELGQLIKEIEICEGFNTKVDLQSLDKGVYFLTGTLDQRKVSRKVLIME